MPRTAVLLTLAIAILMLMTQGSAVVNSGHTTYGSDIQSSSAGSNTTSTPIKHVVNIFMENHSFDNIFGIYPLNNASGMASVEKNLSVPNNLIGHQSLLKYVSAVPAGTFYTKNPLEGWSPYHQDWNGGAMNGFQNGSGEQALTYYTASQMAPEWALSQQYGIADNFYAEQITESMPNHLYYLAGYSPVFNDYGPPPYVPFSQSMMGELSHYGISWSYYIEQPHHSFADWKFFYGINNYRNDLKGWNNFTSDVKSNTLPAVSWLFSQGSGNYSQGAPSNMLNGELWLLHVIDLLESSPVWNSTAIFITYDEFGGYYDQVSPPVFHGIQLGIRIPLIVISPYAKEDYISHTLMTLTSILSFIDMNWNLPALNNVVSESNIPVDFFDFNNSNTNYDVQRSPMSFTSLYGFPSVSSMKFNLTGTMMNFNYAGHFPVTPQINLSKLPYNRTGSSQENLTELGASTFILHNTPYTPFYYSGYFIVLLFLVQVAIASYIMYRRRTGNE